MNLNDGFFANCRSRARLRSTRTKRLNVTTIQKGIPPESKTSRKRNIFESTGTSSDVPWKNNGTGLSFSDINTSSLSNTLNTTGESESKVILVITEGRGEATCEVGIASINIKKPILILCQISDNQSYLNVLTKIYLLNPKEILIPMTMANSRLTIKIKERFHEITITGIPRNSFNKTDGMHFVRHLCAPAWNSIFLILQHKYYALTATSALLTYVENNLFTFYAKESIKVEYQESEGFMIIDVFTADKLELVSCALPESSGEKYSSLHKVMNHCVTKIGARTLRASILQPPCSVTKIEARLNCVQELVNNSEKIPIIQGLLKQISNVDQLLILSTILPEQAQNCSASQLNYILLLNSLFDILEPLGDTLSDFKESFFIELRDTLNSQEFIEIKDILGAIIQPDARPAVGSQGTMARCFAIKAGVCEFLDMIRTKYSDRIDEMRDYVKQLSDKYRLELKLSNNTKKGYHIVMNLNMQQRKMFRKSHLDEEFIQVEHLNTMVTMKTNEILTYSARLDDMIVEILKISNIMIYDLLIEVRKRIGMFYKLCDDIAQLDMFQSLATASTFNQNYVRPKFNEFTEIIQCRHPLLEFLLDNEPTPNDIFASPEYNMHIITGPNGSGKSIFMRQLVLLQVMAQVGCFVPAISATFRVADRILARIYLEDNMDCGASAFVLEIKEIQYFTSVMTKNSLIIIDELCRSTSVKEGTALAMAICESLLKSKAFIFFTTHYTFITKLYDMYFNIKCWQLEADVIETIANKRTLKFTYRVLPGVVSLEKYAIYLVKASWHEHIVRDIENILDGMHINDEKRNVTKIPFAVRLKYDLQSDLKLLKYKKLLTPNMLCQKLSEYKDDLRKFNIDLDNSNALSHIDIESDNSFNTNNEYVCVEAVYSNASNSAEILEQNVSNNLTPVNNYLDKSTHSVLETSNLFAPGTCNFLVPNYEPSVTVKDPYDFETISPIRMENINTNYSPNIMNRLVMTQAYPKEKKMMQTFSQPLQQNIVKTSTPIGKGFEIVGNDFKNDEADSLIFHSYAAEEQFQIANNDSGFKFDDQPPRTNNFSNELKSTKGSFVFEAIYKETDTIKKFGLEIDENFIHQDNQSNLEENELEENELEENELEENELEENELENNELEDEDLESKNCDLNLNLEDKSNKDDEKNVSITYSPNYSYLEKLRKGEITETDCSETKNNSFLSKTVEIHELEIIKQNTDLIKLFDKQDVSKENVTLNSVDLKLPITKLVNQNVSTNSNKNSITLDQIVESESLNLIKNDVLIYNDNQNKSTNNDNSSTNTIKTFYFDSEVNLDQIVDSESLNLIKNDILMYNKNQNKSTNNDNSSSNTNKTFYFDNKSNLISSSSKKVSDNNSSSGKSNKAICGDTSFSRKRKWDENIQTSKTNSSSEILSNLASTSPYDTSETQFAKKSYESSSGKKTVDTSFASTTSTFKTPVQKAMNKMTKKEIQNYYMERDLKLMASGNCNDYAREVLNRPNVKQIQSSKQLVTVHKTSSGTIIIPTLENKQKHQKKKTFKPPLKNKVCGVKYDGKIFSDSNSAVYEEFLLTKDDSQFDFNRFSVNDNIFGPALPSRTSPDFQQDDVDEIMKKYL